MQVILRPAAAADIEDATTWYEQQRSGLGTEFLEAVNLALSAIAENPRLAPSFSGAPAEPCSVVFLTGFTTASIPRRLSLWLACTDDASRGAGAPAVKLLWDMTPIFSEFGARS